MTNQALDQYFTGETTIVSIKDNVSCDLEGESVILNVPQGVYYGLDPVGTFIVNLLQEPRSINSIRDAILAEYDVDSRTCEDDLVTLVRELAANGLVEVRNVARN